MKKILSTEKPFEIRFSEVDMMGVAWHGAYMMYLEDAREAFGNKYGLSYAQYISDKHFVPVVEMKLSYKHPLKYGMKPVVKITYVPSDAAKIIFDYVVYDSESGAICLTARSVQVFMNNDYSLMWYSPDFYTEWKKKMGIL